MTKKGHKSVFTTDDSRLKRLYPAAMDIIAKVYMYHVMEAMNSNTKIYV